MKSKKLSSKTTMLGAMKLSQKLPVVIAGLAVIAAAVTGTFTYFSASESMMRAAEEKLSALGEARKRALANYMDAIRQDLRFQASNPQIRQALESFTWAWQEMGAETAGKPGARLRKLYIDDNPNPVGEKENLDDAGDGSAYSDVHALYHPWLRTFLRERGYHDIFLFDLDGNLVYSVYKEADFATNLVDGEWKDTDLGRAFRAARDAESPDSQSFFDFRPYPPSQDAPASFISQPIYGADGEKIGVLAFQMPIDGINSVMQVSAGMGETGETYIVGSDGLMRSDSRFSEESTILRTRVETDTVASALAGESGVRLPTDYRGVSVVSAFAPFDFLGTRWAILADIDEDEVLAPTRSLRLMIVAAILIIAGIVSAIGYLLARQIVRPIQDMTRTMGLLAGGDKSVEIPGRDRRDEIGEMAGAVQVFKEAMVRSDELAAAEKAEQKKREERVARLNDLMQRFDSEMAEVLDTVARASEGTRETAHSLTRTAEETSRKSSTIAAAADEASANVQTVASAAEELSSSVQEISRQVAESTEIAKQAVGEAERTNQTVQGLADAASKIGDVVNLINDIADQTNLLALNATIEAARAGEAGKGFAVVANEVKSLANQTAKATEEIAAQITAMQGVTTDAVGAIQSIGETIGRIDEIASAIAAAVEEQGAATAEIARNIQQAAAGNNEVTGNIASINEAAGNSADAAKEMLAAAEDMNRHLEALREKVHTFLADVKAA